MSVDHLLLVGGGHSHSLLLLRWAMSPHLRPSGMITLITRFSTTLYSSMVPGWIAGIYSRDQVEVNLRDLASKSGVGFILAEVKGLDLAQNAVLFQNRPSIHFSRISLDVGSDTIDNSEIFRAKGDIKCMAIKPLEKSLAWIESQDDKAFLSDDIPFTVVGSGLAAIEIAFALRKRWPDRLLYLQCNDDKHLSYVSRALSNVSISFLKPFEPIKGPALLCTGSKAPRWLSDCGMPVDSAGRIRTQRTLQVVGYPQVFASGDCGVVDQDPRPAAGVWAVRAAKSLARNLERSSKNKSLVNWYPQKKALQLLSGYLPGGSSVSWAIRDNLILGPHPLLWKLKEWIDFRFIAKFRLLPEMSQISPRSETQQFCRGCAAKVSAKTLRDGLLEVDLAELAGNPDDAVLVDCAGSGEKFFQSVDGFPALVSDPWLNGRISALHACSDLWACGIRVDSAQALITLPVIDDQWQKELLVQTLAGIKSALEQQGACLIGGHTFESRNIDLEPKSLSVQVSLSVNGKLSKENVPWAKGGMQVGDALLISRPLGIGVLFAAAMTGDVKPVDLDFALCQLTESQHILLDELLSIQQYKDSDCHINACTDITGFGLIGHLEEMLLSSNNARKINGKDPLGIKLQAELIPSIPGSINLFERGFCSTLAPQNRLALESLLPNENSPSLIQLILGEIDEGSRRHQSILELIVDPQTCGPLLISCTEKFAQKILTNKQWSKIGEVHLGGY